ncbi:hypothetical protein [Fusibacter ferrireducens]|uniref:Flp pilus assembly protein TadB n=1 Tax=Fusibacter ferrireducens TaxID=2785058 RepID=A0ABS0A0Q8_9FIRM|nr:hypothetical protein [Fusibacter ferrireducens]MBF4695464.1 hypothetical protein [Fusibacter ferrireducens]
MMTSITIGFLILNLIWIGILIFGIYKNQKWYVELMQENTYHSYKLKASAFKLHINMCVNSLPKRIQNLYFEYALLYVILSTFALYWVGLPLLFKVIFMTLNMALPYFILEISLGKVEYEIDGELLGFLQSISASLHQTEDLIKALKYAEKMAQNRYIKNLLVTFNTSIQSGLDEKLAFQYFYKFAGHDYLKYIVLNLEQVYFRRGNLIKLISGLEQEYTAIQVEINKRKIELKQDRILTLASMLIVLMTAYKIVNSNDYIKLYYLTSDIGKMLLGIMGISYVLGIILVVKATQIKY